MTYDINTDPKVLRIGAALVAIEPGWSAGFFVAPHLIATAAHCLRDRPEFVEIHLRNGDVIQGRIVRRNFETDVGIIHVNRFDHRQTPLEIEPTNLPSWYHLNICNAVLMKERNHNGHPFEIHTGKYVATRKANPRFLDVKECIITDIYSRQGFSGAPFVDEDGKVIGLLHSSNDREVFGASNKQIFEAISNW